MEGVFVPLSLQSGLNLVGLTTLHIIFLQILSSPNPPSARPEDCAHAATPTSDVDSADGLLKDVCAFFI